MRMHKLGLLLIAALFGLVLSGCEQHVKGNGSTQTVAREVGNFNQIQLVGNFQVTVNPGQTQQVTITTDSNIIPYLDTQVDNNVLTIRVRKGYALSTAEPPQMDITFNQLQGITINGSSAATFNNVANNQFAIQIVGNGGVNIAGRAENADMKITGSGNINATNFHIQNASVKTTGAGNVNLFVTKKLMIEVNGAGKVVYYGEPREVKQKINGSGEVIGVPDNAKKN